MVIQLKINDYLIDIQLKCCMCFMVKISKWKWLGINYLDLGQYVMIVYPQCG